MKRSILLLSAFMALLLSACQAARSGSSPSATLTLPTATLVASLTPQPQPTPTASQPGPSVAQTEVSPTAAQPTASPTPASTAVATATLPASTATAPATQATQAPQTSSCSDRATFEADVTIPDDTLFQPGDRFTKTWRLYNSGTCAWDEGYSIIFAYGDAMDAPLSSPLPATAPGASVNVSLDMSAPASAGQHAGNWQLQNAAGEHFGVGQNGQDYFWVQVVVSYAGASAAGNPPPAGSSPSTGGNTQNTPAGCTYSGDSPAEAEILQQINAIRSMHGLGTLTRQPQLDAAALDYSLDMACNNRVDFTRHTDSQGGRWYERIAAQGYAYSKAFENVYAGNPAYGGTAQGAINWWMNSPIHRDNILNPDIVQVGIAYAFTETSEYGGYYTVDFATP